MTFFLPSGFSGGAISLSKNDFSEKVDASRDSEYNITVVSWFPDVSYAIRPIESGTQVTLSYNIISTKPLSQIPTSLLSPTLVYQERLRRLLGSWKDHLDSGPVFVMELLRTVYLEGLAKRNLDDVDAHLVSLLEPFCNELGFKLAFGNVDLTIRRALDPNEAEARDFQLKPDEKPKPRHYSRGYASGDESYDSDETDEWATYEEYDGASTGQRLRIRDIVDMNGAMVLAELHPGHLEEFNSEYECFEDDPAPNSLVKAMLLYGADRSERAVDQRVVSVPTRLYTFNNAHIPPFYHPASLFSLNVGHVTTR